ncbi:MAG TPA: hypothetical protein VL095_07455, partial [Flavisolibacter sp.]|nr:hypothetical protein [Flavisolibacter sp.]
VHYDTETEGENFGCNMCVGSSGSSGEKEYGYVVRISMLTRKNIHHNQASFINLEPKNSHHE